jgi:hypothetical protein
MPNYFTMELSNSSVLLRRVPKRYPTPPRVQATLGRVKIFRVPVFKIPHSAVVSRSQTSQAPLTTYPEHW